MRYLITGHTGFKGAWLTLWLTQAGHKVIGLALDPEPGSLYETARVFDTVEHDIREDIRDAGVVRDVVREANPDVLIHMAAQPLVRESYRDPRWTLETNVLGTLNLLEAASSAPRLRAHVVVTTDKVYRNVNQIAGYTETDALGGDDPYSASKAMADILTHSWATSFNGPPTAIVRAGNVIGGGDVSKERLFPDIIRALAEKRAPELRYPQAVRPWQHVLDCLNGYQALIDHLLDPATSDPKGSAWNFGPDQDNLVSVGAVTRMAAARWGTPHHWSITSPEYHEAGLLALNSSKAHNELGWRNFLPLAEAVNWTIDWYREAANEEDPRVLTLRQIRLFEKVAEESNNPS